MQEIDAGFIHEFFDRFPQCLMLVSIRRTTFIYEDLNRDFSSLHVVENGIDRTEKHDDA